MMRRVTHFVPNPVKEVKGRVNPSHDLQAHHLFSSIVIIIILITITKKYLRGKERDSWYQSRWYWYTRYKAKEKKNRSSGIRGLFFFWQKDLRDDDLILRYIPSCKLVSVFCCYFVICYCSWCCRECCRCKEEWERERVMFFTIIIMSSFTLITRTRSGLQSDSDDSLLLPLFPSLSFSFPFFPFLSPSFPPSLSVTRSEVSILSWLLLPFPLKQ